MAGDSSNMGRRGGQRVHTRGCGGGRQAEEAPDRSEARACREGVEAIVGGAHRWRAP